MSINKILGSNRDDTRINCEPGKEIPGLTTKIQKVLEMDFSHYELNCCIIGSMLNIGKKILIIGSMASGKTYLLERLKGRTSLSIDIVMIDIMTGEEDLSKFYNNTGVAIAAQSLAVVAKLLHISEEDLLNKTDFIVITRFGELEIMETIDYQEAKPFDIRSFMKENILFTNEVSEELKISRQRVSYLVNHGRLIPIKVSKKGPYLFLKEDIDRFRTSRYK